MRVIAGVMLGALFGVNPAGAADARYWEHKDWGAVADTNIKGENECTARTGGDGSDSFVVHANRHGDVSIYFDEASARGYPTNLKGPDVVRFVVAGKQETVFEDVSVESGIDDEGIPFANAGTPSSNSPALVKAMRAGSRIRIERETRPGGPIEVVGNFSLSGFTATFLKISEWCGFDPDIKNRS